MGVEKNKGTKGNEGYTVVPFGGDLGGGKYSSPEAAQPTVDYYKNEATYWNDTNSKTFDHIRVMHQIAQSLEQSTNGASAFAPIAAQHLKLAAEAHQDATARGDYDYSAVEPHVTAAHQLMAAVPSELSATGNFMVGHQRMLDKFNEAHANFQKVVSPATITKSDSGGYRINLDTAYRLRTGDKTFAQNKRREASRTMTAAERKADYRARMKAKAAAEAAGTQGEA